MSSVVKLVPTCCNNDLIQHNHNYLFWWESFGFAGQNLVSLRVPPSQQGCNPPGVCLSQRWWSPSNTRLIFNGIWWFNRINFSSVCLYLNNNTGTWWAIGKWRPLRDHRSNHCVIDDVNSGISTSSSSSSSCCWTVHSRTRRCIVITLQTGTWEKFPITGIVQ